MSNTEDELFELSMIHFMQKHKVLILPYTFKVRDEYIHYKALLRLRLLLWRHYKIDFGEIPSLTPIQGREEYYPSSVQAYEIINQIRTAITIERINPRRWPNDVRRQVFGDQA